MTQRDLVVVGASAGGVEALTRFVAGLSADLPATVLVVLHVPADSTSVLASILARSGPLPADAAKDGDPLVPGRILVAPPGQHLTLDDDAVRLTRGPRENGNRPSIDVLFRAAARMGRERVVAVVLSGSNDDGLAGAMAVRTHGGVVLAQDPATAMFRTMPASVAAELELDGTGSPQDLAALVNQLSVEPAEHRDGHVPGERLEVEVAADDDEAVLHGRQGMEASGFICPDCGGSLFRVEDDRLVRFRCRIGHAWSALGLLGQQGLSVEGALWSAIRTLEERAELNDGMGRHALDSGRRSSARHFVCAAEDARRSAELLKHVLDALPEEPLPDGGPSAADEDAVGSQR